jgi:hypothetical protein
VALIWHGQPTVSLYTVHCLPSEELRSHLVTAFIPSLLPLQHGRIHHLRPEFHALSDTGSLRHCTAGLAIQVVRVAMPSRAGQVGLGVALVEVGIPGVAAQYSTIRLNIIIVTWHGVGQAGAAPCQCAAM